jgi:hypothetical protein
MCVILGTGWLFNLCIDLFLNLPRCIAFSKVFCEHCFYFYLNRVDQLSIIKLFVNWWNTLHQPSSIS